MVTFCAFIAGAGAFAFFRMWSGGHWFVAERSGICFWN